MVPISRRRLLATCSAAACVLGLATLIAQRAPDPRPGVHPLEHPEQMPAGTGSTLMAEASELIHANRARARFHVTGRRMAAVVIDSGIRASHKSFCGRVLKAADYTGNQHANPGGDRCGHGTNVAGIIAGSSAACDGLDTRLHDGIAPEASLYSLKAANDAGASDYPWIGDALRAALALVRATQTTPDAPLIGAVNLSIGSREALDNDVVADRAGIIAAIVELHALDVPVIVAAGNDFALFESAQGMTFPAIVRQTISVGAVFSQTYRNKWYEGAFVREGLPRQIAPFSQRLYQKENGNVLGTDFFAPGAEILSAGIANDLGTSRQKGTSQAAPMVTGTILLLQQYYNARRASAAPAGGATWRRAPIDRVVGWLKAGSLEIEDNYGENDNVNNTGKTYRLLDALAALEALKTDADRSALP